jgi:hypothetical protein
VDAKVGGERGGVRLVSDGAQEVEPGRCRAARE